MASAVNALDAHEAYIKRVRTGSHGPKDDWFLRLLSSSEFQGLPMEQSCLHVLDFDGNAAPKEVLRAAACGSVQDEVIDGLNSTLSPSAMRFVFLYYPHFKYLNMKYVGVIGHILGLDLRFFTSHFQYSPSRSESVDEFRQLSTLLHLDTAILNFRLQAYRHITACTLRNVGKSCIITKETFTAS